MAIRDFLTTIGNPASKTPLNNNFGVIADKVDEKFNATTGHKHTGDTGDAPKIGITSFDDTIVGEDGKILDENISDNIARTQNESGGFAGGNGAIAEGAGGAIGSNAFTNNGAAIGDGSHSTQGVAIGIEAYTGNGIAIGQNATTVDLSTDETVDAIQLGTGNNQEVGTFQVYGFRVLDAIGNIDPGRIYTSIPASSSSIGVAGQMAYDGNYFYLCTGINTWARFAKSAW